jgi:predicted RNA-binding Zn ribbon-like protein
MSEVLFDIGAGDISLDFANTVNWHASQHPEEILHNYDDLVAWGKATGIISLESNERTCKLADEHPGDAQRAYHDALVLREAIYRVFSRRYAGETIPSADLELINATVAQAMAHRKVVPAGDEFIWEWDENCDEPDLIMWKVAIAATDLLTSDQVLRVRECEDDRGCGYLFIDMSKNHSRRWCSMDSCGNRAKALRHYSRSKAEASES